MIWDDLGDTVGSSSWWGEVGDNFEKPFIYTYDRVIKPVVNRGEQVLNVAGNSLDFVEWITEHPLESGLIVLGVIILLNSL